MTIKSAAQDGLIRQRNLQGDDLQDALRVAKVVEGFVVKPGFIYTVVRAISARVNQNYDGWPSEELKKAAHTFLGKPCFVNHFNEEVRLARGKIVAARYVENGLDKYIECIMEIDAERFPRLAAVILDGSLDSVSMGAEAGYTICSYCNNHATVPSDFCEHVRLYKGMMLPRKTASGDYEDVLVYETCHDIRFFELSYVFDPADETAMASKIIQASKTADKCHYCDDDAVEGRSSCETHHLMEDNKIEGSLQSFEDWLRSALKKRSFGETEAPEAVDTLRDEDEDENDDFKHYVESPKELRDPDLDRTKRLDREQEEDGLDEDRRVEDIEDQNPEDGEGDEVARTSTKQVTAGWNAHCPGCKTLLIPESAAETEEEFPFVDDETGWATCPNCGTVSDIDGESGNCLLYSKKKKGNTMSEGSLADRGRVAARGRKVHRRQAEGPLVDTGDQSRNDQGEQEETFITETPAAEPVDAPADDEANINNTEQNLVARIKRDRAALKIVQEAKSKLAELGYDGDNDNTNLNENAGETADVVNPEVNTSAAGEALTGDDFESADPNEGVVETQPKDASVEAFARFDAWLAGKTDKRVAQHTNPAFVRRHAKMYAVKTGTKIEALFPTLTTELKKIASKNPVKPGASQKRSDVNGKKPNTKQAVDLDTAAPDGRVDVEAPTADTTDEEAQASQFDLGDFGNNAGDDVADPDLRTDNPGSGNWAPGEGPSERNSRVKKSSAAQAVELADLVVECGVRPAEKRYELIAMHESMSANVVADRIRCYKSVKPVIQALREKVTKQAAGGSSAGSRPSSPMGLGRGVAAAARPSNVRAAAVTSHDPADDYLIFG